MGHCHHASSWWLWMSIVVIPATMGLLSPHLHSHATQHGKKPAIFLPSPPSSPFKGIAMNYHSLKSPALPFSSLLIPLCMWLLMKWKKLWNCNFGSWGERLFFNEASWWECSPQIRQKLSAVNWRKQKSVCWSTISRKRCQLNYSLWITHLALVKELLVFTKLASD